MEWEVALARELDIEPPNAARVEGIPEGPSYLTARYG